METEKISIPKTHLSFLIPSYQKKLSELKTELNRLVEEISSIDLVLKSINDKSTDSEIEVPKTEEQNLQDTEIDLFDKVAGYDKSWPWVKKIIFCLENINRPLGTGEILKFLVSKDQDLKGKGRRLSAIISFDISKTNPTLYKIEQGRGKQLYGLKKWQTGNKQIVQEGIFTAIESNDSINDK